MKSFGLCQTVFHYIGNISSFPTKLSIGVLLVVFNSVLAVQAQIKRLTAIDNIIFFIVICCKQSSILFEREFDIRKFFEKL